MSTTQEMRTTDAPGTRDRLLFAAGELFYADGIRNVSIERVLESAAVTRSTMYRYFRTKEDLVLAYLAHEDAKLRLRLAEAAADPGVPLLDAVVRSISYDICQPGFRGCAFMNAAVEFPNPAHPVRLAVRAHREWFEQALVQLLRQAAHPEPQTAARALVALRDGAMMGGYLDDSKVVAGSLEWAARSVLAFS
ncbi:MAG: TetR family transcriptional regulator [Frankiales bacterium]|jgi:AcrR family transcriptional regulator|nr:TetR family transcriptional regulator [Frankiales bacterium]